MILKAFCGFFCAAVLMASNPGAARAQGCSFSATNVDFGTVDTLGSGATDISGTITVSCSALLGLLSSFNGRIHIGEGSGGGDGSARQMTSATTATDLNYQLYKDSARTVVLGGDYWGHGESIDLSAFAVLIIGSGSANIPFNGRVFGAQQAVAPGSYQSNFFRDITDVRVNYRTCTLLFLCTNRTATFSFDVLAEVEDNCLVSATNLDFGSVGVLTSPIDAASEVSVTCTAHTDYHVGLDHGFYGTGPLDRFMRSGAGSSVRYGLYQDAARSLPWGTLAEGAARPGTGSGSTQNFPVYGRVPPQNTPPAGTYSDTIVVTVTY
ncbi:spore coat U domain-containing protein [Alkalilacustris brevis]|uniref:Csu type fimbrial protein n=1 Tax=Alkalilacustris brevis TaxID=2026338 RepID=UPI00138FDD2A|nr:spore coat U domain-containing protein [Alkalilacustris brevis]